MRLLLDTHTLLWALDRPRVLSRDARAAIADPANDVAVSAVSVWELSLKARKLDARPNLSAELARFGFAPLAITWDHAAEVAALPLHHRDPFDRLLIAQARVEGLRIVTRDQAFEPYGVPLLSA